MGLASGDLTARLGPGPWGSPPGKFPKPSMEPGLKRAVGEYDDAQGGEVGKWDENRLLLKALPHLCPFVFIRG